MDHYSDQGCDEIELLDWLFDQNNGMLPHEQTGNHGNHHTWPIQDPNVPEQADNDFLNALLSAGDSVSGSPLWSPSPSDSGISEDPPSDQMDSPQRPESPPEEAQYFSPQPQTKAALESNFSIDLNSWEPGFPAGRAAVTQYPSDVQRPQLSSGFPLTVKDLLLSGTPEPVIGLSCRCLFFPLYEERILKKIRRKIRNKQSAQESRKKKKEYIDGLESRMAACSAHNQELQRKVFQLEKYNTSLMEQLRRLQALVMNSSNKPAQTGTCVLVLLLSFSLILFPSLKPFSDTKVSQGDFSPVRIQSRSLHSLQASRVLHMTDPPFSADDEPESLHRHFPGDLGMDEITSLISKLGVDQELSDLKPMSLNRSQEEELRHFHGDPITGRIAMVTLDPHHPAKLRPHADDM
uniref:cAMP responsive element binding protein 3-like 3a n=1 Tax=Myripristis murdjan TaxID=586833 RepID=A0A667X2T7_9TELE